MDNEEFSKKRYPSSDISGNILNVVRIEKSINIFKKFFSGKAKSKILDMGCRDGVVISKICEEIGGEGYGVDLSKNAAELAKKRGIHVKVGNVEKKIEFDNEFFDGVFAGDIIEHLFDTDFFLDEIKRVLKKDGLLVLTTPNLASWYNRIFLLFGWQPGSTEVSLRHYVGRPLIKRKEMAQGKLDSRPPGHIHVFTLGSLKDLVKIHGFRIRSIYGSYGKDHPFPLNLIDWFFSFFPGFSSEIVVCLQKI